MADLIKNIRRGDSVDYDGRLDRQSHARGRRCRARTRNRTECQGAGCPGDDFGRAVQGRAGQGARLNPWLKRRGRSEPMAAAAPQTVEICTNHAAFSGLEDHIHSGDDGVRAAPHRAEPVEPGPSRGVDFASAEVGARPRHRARPRSARRIACAFGGGQQFGRENSCRQSARQRPPGAARGESFDHGRHRRSAARRAIAHPRCRRARAGHAETQAIGGDLRQRHYRYGARSGFRRDRKRQRSHSVHGDRGGRRQQDPPRGRAIDRSAAPPRRCARHDRAEYPAPRH